jgi:hypothetical protein
MLPHPMDINTVCEVRGILVDDTFGRHTFIRAAGRGPETQWQRFSMFHLTEHGTREDAAGHLFYLPPAVGKVAGECADRASEFHARRDGEHGVGRGVDGALTDRARCERIRNHGADERAAPYVGRRERAHSLLGHDGSSQLDSVHSRQTFTFWISPERIISVATRAVASAVL